MKQWVLASSNQGKIEEMSGILCEFGIQVIPQTELGVEDAEETGTTFIENAILKARHAAQVTGRPALADDSGLEVDALQGAPGVYSARYAGVGASAADCNNKLLAAMQGVPAGQRSARFHCVLAFMRHAQDPTPIICQGTWQGEILTEAVGGPSFGYNPVFWVPEHQCSAAQLSLEQKKLCTHRGQALQQLQQALQQLHQDESDRAKHHQAVGKL